VPNPAAPVLLDWLAARGVDLHVVLSAQGERSKSFCVA
jgi:hypothetical protein